MLKKLLAPLAVGVGILALSTSMSGAASIPAPATLLGGDHQAGGLVQQIQDRPLAKFGGYYSRCYYWRRECRRRWGWGTRRYRNCVALHFCRLRPAR